MAGAGARRRGVGEHVQPLRPRESVRRVQGVRVRPRGRPAGARGLPADRGELTMSDSGSRSARPTSCTSAGPSRARESGRTYEVPTRRGASWPMRRAPRARTPATPWSPPAPRSPGWAGATAYNRGQVLYRVAEVMEGRRAQFEDEVAARRGARRAPGRRRSSTPRSTAGSGTPAGPTSWPRSLGSANPVAGPFFNFSVPEPTGVVAVVAPQASSLLGLVSVVAPVLVGGSTAVVVASRQRPLPAITLAEVLATSDLPGRGGQPAHRAGRGDRPVAGLAPRRQRHRPRGRRRRGPGRGAGAGRGRQRQAGRARARGQRPTGRTTRDRRGCGRSWRSRRSGTRSVSEDAAYARAVTWYATTAALRPGPTRSSRRGAPRCSTRTTRGRTSTTGWS